MTLNELVERLQTEDGGRDVVLRITGCQLGSEPQVCPRLHGVTSVTTDRKRVVIQGDCRETAKLQPPKVAPVPGLPRPRK